MRPLCRPSSSSSSSVAASSGPTSPSPIAAIRAARRPRYSSPEASERTAWASASATSCACSESGIALVIVLADQRAQLVLEPSGLDRAVDAALLGRVLLPPPPAVAALLARCERPGAGGTADRRVAAVVERVVGDVALADVVPDLVLGPLGERVELHDSAVVVVDLDLPDVRPARPLVSAQAGDPGVQRCQVAGERLHLADVAAEQAVLDLPVEEVRPIPADHRLHLPRVRREQIELHLRVPIAQLLDQVVRLGRQTARVDAEDPDARIELVRHVEQRDAVDLEGRGQRDPRREALECPLEQLLRLAAFELDRELAGLEIVDQVDHATSFSRARAGSRPTRAPSSSSLVRSQNVRKSSASPRAASQPSTSRSTVSSSSSVGTRRKSGRAIAAPGPSPPRRNTSYAWRRLPASSR